MIFCKTCPFIELFCVVNAYPTIHNVKHWQVVWEHGEFELAHFFFHLSKSYIHFVSQYHILNNRESQAMEEYFPKSTLFQMIAVKCVF